MSHLTGPCLRFGVDGQVLFESAVLMVAVLEDLFLKIISFLRERDQGGIREQATPAVAVAVAVSDGIGCPGFQSNAHVHS